MSDDFLTQETSQSQDNGPKNVYDSQFFDEDLKKDQKEKIF